MNLQDIPRMRASCVDVLDELIPYLNKLAEKEPADFVAGTVTNVAIELLALSFASIPDHKIEEALSMASQAVASRAKQVRAMAHTSDILERMKKQ